MRRTNTETDDGLSLSEQEKDLIKREFMRRFGGSRSIHDGILLRRWATGERKGQVKVPLYVQAMVDRGLLTVADDGGPWVSARFTDKGFAALSRLIERATRGWPEDLYSDFLAEVRALSAEAA